MSSLTTRIALAAAAGVAALIVTTVTVWFFGEALLLLLEGNGFTPAAAAGLTGLAGLVLTVLIGVLARVMVRPRRGAVPAIAAPRPSSGSVVNDLALELGNYVAQQTATAARAHPYGTVGAALAAGLAVGALPELRKTLTDLIKPRV